MTLVFLSANDVEYSKEVNDDWYSAHQRPPPSTLSFDSITGNGTSTGTLDWFASDEAATVLGCKSQYQVCDSETASLRRCSQPGGAYDIGPPSFSAPTQTQQGNQAMLWVVNSATTFDTVIKLMAAKSLISRFSLDEGTQGPLPDNQWQLEVQNWHNTSLVNFQGAVLDQATGPDNIDMLRNFWRGPKSDAEKKLCKSQVRSIRIRDYTIECYHFPLEVLCSDT